MNTPALEINRVISFMNLVLGGMRDNRGCQSADLFQQMKETKFAKGFKEELNEKYN